jgi:hypothetical protein
MKKISFILLSIVIIASSCRGTLQTVGVVRPQATLMVDTIHSRMIVDKTKKIEGSAVMKKFLIFTVKSPNNYADNELNPIGAKIEGIAMLKGAAIRDALTNSNKEYIIAPKFDISIQKTLFSKTIIVKVEGYGGNMELK